MKYNLFFIASLYKRYSWNKTVASQLEEHQEFIGRLNKQRVFGRLHLERESKTEQKDKKLFRKIDIYSRFDNNSFEKT